MSECLATLGPVLGVLGLGFCFDEDAGVGASFEKSQMIN
jgi:hypothetical protein